MRIRVQYRPPQGFFDSLWQDVRFAGRILLRAPGVSAAVVFALALGIGANAALFSLVDAILLHTMRYEDPASLAVIWEKNPQGSLRLVSAANFLDMRNNRSFTEIAGWTPVPFVLAGLDRPEQVVGARVTANFFRTLGVRAHLGRTFLPDEDGLENPANASRSAVISYRLWQDVLGADPTVLGRNIKLDDEAYTIVGVMPEDFQFRQRQAVWVPAVLDRTDRDYHFLVTIGRLRSARPVAAEEMHAIFQRLVDTYPNSNRGRTVQVDQLSEWLVASSAFRTRLLILFAAVGMVLLIACTNVASLMLARSTARYREIALRAALGANRLRLARQLLTESVLLALIGGLCGLVLAWFLIRSAPTVLPPNLVPTGIAVELSPLVVAFTIAVSMLTGMLFGMAPAVAASNPDIQETLQDTTKGAAGSRSGNRFRQLMVVVEVALALILLAGAGLMTESLRRLNTLDLGFAPDRVHTLRVVLPSSRYDAASASRMQQQLLERVSRLPGVQAAAIASNLPLAQLSVEIPFDLSTSPYRPLVERPGVGLVSISPKYLETLGIALRRGRAFTEQDREGAPPVAIVNQAFASRYFATQDPIGERLVLNRPLLGRTKFGEDERVEIVGVVSNVRLNNLNAPPDPIVYVPQAQGVWTTVSWLAVRANVDAGVLNAGIRGAMGEIDKEQPVEQLGSLEQVFDLQLAQPRFQSQVMAGLALLSFVLAVVGIYGINAYTVSRERREIGIRMALGATPGLVVRQTVLRGMLPTAAGIVLGLIGAVLLTPSLRSVLEGVGTTDPVLLAAVALFLTAVGAVACFIPAQRAARVDPVTSLRQD